MRAHTYSKAIPKLTIGIDLGDRRSRLYWVNQDGELVAERWVSMTRAGRLAALAPFSGARIAMEAGTHSRWVSQLLEELGHEVIVAKPSELFGRKRHKRRNDKLDAEKLARLARVDPALLYPIRHRSEAAQTDLAILQSRDTLVQTRSKLINHVRGSVKPFGERVPSCSAESFMNRATEAIPKELRPALGPVLKLIRNLTDQMRAFDKQLEERAKVAYPETERLRQIAGVGPLTSLVYVLVVEDPKHFPRPREVGSYAAKKRAIVAVARKLAVLLHRLWETGADYVPLREASAAA